VFRSERRLPIAAAAFAIATLIAIFALDGTLATSIATLSRETRNALNAAVHGFELAFLFPLSKWATGAVLLIVAALLATMRKYRAASWAFAFVGCAQLATRLIAGVLKNPFGRMRPFEALADGHWDDRWFAGGSSFPSGHGAHFWGLYFALALLFPKWRWPLLVVPVFISAARVLVNDHYLADVLGSAAIAAVVTWGLAKFFLLRARPLPPS
jgi:undecaprenyl-diphosphatase